MDNESELFLATIISLIFVWFFGQIPQEDIFVPT
jgi:hypothetical protein